MRPISRRTLLAVPPAFALAAPAIAQGQTFVVATFGGLFEQTLRERIIPEFESRHGVRVQLELGTGSVFIPKMIASPRRSPYDVVHLNDDEAILGASLGLWAPDQSAKLSHAGQITPTLRTDRLPMYASVVYELPLVYRPEKMAAPTSWNDLWQPGITVGVPHISNSYGLTFLTIAALLNGGDAANLAPAFPALARLPRFKIYRGVTQGHAMFQQGEVDAGLFYGHRAQQLIDQGVKLATAAPKEGLWGQRTGAQIPKTATRLDLSAAWIDMTLGAAFQEVFARLLYSPTNTTVALPPDLAEKLVVGEARVGRLKYPDWTAINPQRDDLLTKWTQTFGG
jgi:putative spermidine/putrescine transport system substrate-binding protein